MTHLLSIVTLLLKIHATKSCAGVSMRTQELYALVFVARYLDLFFNFISFYNTVMKLIFISSSFTILWYMRRHKVVSQTYDKEQVRENDDIGLFRARVVTSPGVHEAVGRHWSDRGQRASLARRLPPSPSQKNPKRLLTVETGIDPGPQGRCSSSRQTHRRPHFSFR
jgi:hypothetical protein